jgi:citrate synthase
VLAQVGLAPSLDFGLVAAGRVLGLPAGAPLLIFALGRIAGWVGHIIEQYQANHLIRPRARYTGPQPRTSAS